MDFRLHVRKPLALDAVVSYPQLGLFSVRTRNVSIGGMLIETEGMFLPRGEDVYVCFRVYNVDDDRLCTTPARVVHTSFSGTGLKFRGLDLDSREALSALLLDAEALV